MDLSHDDFAPLGQGPPLTPLYAERPEYGPGTERAAAGYRWLYGNEPAPPPPASEPGWGEETPFTADDRISIESFTKYNDDLEAAEAAGRLLSHYDAARETITRNLDEYREARGALVRDLADERVRYAADRAKLREDLEGLAIYRDRDFAILHETIAARDAEIAKLREERDSWRESCDMERAHRNREYDEHQLTTASLASSEARLARAIRTLNDVQTELVTSVSGALAGQLANDIEAVLADLRREGEGE